MEARVLIIDDDDKIRNLISIYLQNEGFETLMAASAEEGFRLLKEIPVDLIVLDVMLPDMDGIQACLQIRQQMNLPILMVSAKSEEMDIIHGISTGADDYLTKPFNPMELIVRVKALLRRCQKYSASEARKSNVIEIGQLRIDTDTRSVWVADDEVRLTPKEFDILCLLASNKGVVMSTAKIYEAVWEEHFLKSDNNVMVHITKIRDKIEPDPKKPIYIKTVWGVGYKI